MGLYELPLRGDVYITPLGYPGFSNHLIPG
jgi:hypothetical protein